MNGKTQKEEPEETKAEPKTKDHKSSEGKVLTAEDKIILDKKMQQIYAEMKIQSIKQVAEAKKPLSIPNEIHPNDHFIFKALNRKQRRAVEKNIRRGRPLFYGIRVPFL